MLTRISKICEVFLTEIKAIANGSQDSQELSPLRPKNDEQPRPNASEKTFTSGKSVPQASSSDSRNRPASTSGHRGTSPQTRTSASHRKTAVANTLSTEDTLRLNLERKNAEIASLRKQWEQEVAELVQQQTRLRRNELELQATNRNLVLARQERESAGKDPLEYELYQKNQEIWRLTHRVQNMLKLASFLQRDPAEPHFLDTKEIDDAMDGIVSQLELILQGHNTSKYIVIPDIVSGSDLALLVHSSMDGASESGHEKSWLKRSLAKFGFGSLVRALIVASLKDWVFDTDFPNFAPGDQHLLQAYRDVVIDYGT